MKSFLFLLCLLPSLAHTAEFTRTRILMGNVPVTLTVMAPLKKQGKVFLAMEKAYAEALRIENAVSEFNPESETSLLNQNAGKQGVVIHKDLRKILRTARQLSEKTGGAFDITFASPLNRATFRDVEVSHRHARLSRAGVKIGVSSIAKGYIVDEMSHALKRRGFRNHLVNAGGDIRAGGKWEVEIRNPHGGLGIPLVITDGAISTSGTYERGPHIINPHTRRPVTRSASATVLAPTSILASPLATSAFVLGEKRGRECLKNFGEVALIYQP